jgi:hypothetical protein
MPVCEHPREVRIAGRLKYAARYIGMAHIKCRVPANRTDFAIFFGLSSFDTGNACSGYEHTIAIVLVLPSLDGRQGQIRHFSVFTDVSKPTS